MRSFFALAMALIMTVSLSAMLVTADTSSKLEITQIFNVDLMRKGVMLPVGDNEKWQDAIDTWNRSFMLMGGLTADEENEAALVLERLDTSGVNIYKTGDYTVTALMKLDDEYSDSFTISDETRTIIIPVRVTDTNEFDLWVTGYTPAFFSAAYLYDASEDIKVCFLSSSVKKTSKELIYESAQEVPTGSVACGNGILRIFRSFIKNNIHYYFCIKSGDNYSNFIHICDDGSFLDYGSIGGYRDGNDGGLNQLPAYTQPAPIPIEEPEVYFNQKVDTALPINPVFIPSAENTDTAYSSEVTLPPEITVTEAVTEVLPQDEVPAVTEVPAIEYEIASTSKIPYIAKKIIDFDNRVTTTEKNDVTPKTEITAEAAVAETPAAKQVIELVSDTKDVISGARINLMLKNTEYAEFSKKGITVKIPRTFLNGLKLEDTDMLTVEITENDRYSSTLSVLLNEEPIGEIKGMEIALPYSGDYVNPVVYSDGEAIAGTYDYTSGTISFFSDKSGSFSIKSDSTPESSSFNFRILYIIVSIVMLAAIIVFCAITFIKGKDE